jgi:hypothetical protein
VLLLAVKKKKQRLPLLLQLSKSLLTQLLPLLLLLLLHLLLPLRSNSKQSNADSSAFVRAVASKHQQAIAGVFLCPRTACV